MLTGKSFFFFFFMLRQDSTEKPSKTLKALKPSCHSCGFLKARTASPLPLCLFLLVKDQHRNTQRLFLLLSSCIVTHIPVIGFMGRGQAVWEIYMWRRNAAGLERGLADKGTQGRQTREDAKFHSKQKKLRVQGPVQTVIPHVT